MAVVVSDTSPIRALAELKLLGALGVLFAEVHVPPAVADELLHPPRRFNSVDVLSLSNTTIRKPNNQERVRELRAELDAGEAEALALAEEIRADAVLIDETIGRNVATRMGLPVLGTLGILLRARQCGICQELRPLLDALQFQHHFFLSSELRNEVLRRAGEAP